MKKKNISKRGRPRTAKVTKKPGLRSQHQTVDPMVHTDDQIHDEARAKLASLFGISLQKPKQSHRIKHLHDLYQEHLNKSQVECFLYEKISTNAQSLGEIYAKQRAEIKKLEALNENKEFFSTRLAYVINRYRVEVEYHKKEIKEAQDLLEIYKRDASGLPHFSLESKEKVEEMELASLQHYLKAFEVNKELRNNIIGYENRLCVYRLNKLFLDYKLYVNQEIIAYQERQKTHNAKLNMEFDEVLSHFSLPDKKMANFCDFLSNKLLSTIETIEKLKEPLKLLYERDVEQIDRMVREMESHQSNDLNSMVQVINHYQKIILDKEARSNNNAQYLVALVEKLFTERINQSYELVARYDDAKEKNRNLNQKEIDLLLELNRRELKSSIEKLKHQFTNMIKPLTDDFDKMQYVIDHDHALDKAALQEKMVELKSLENKNIQFFSEQFENEKAEIEKSFNEVYDLIMDDCKYTKDQFEMLFAKCKKEVRNICVNIIARNERFWLKTKNEFTLEAKKFLTRLHYENAPWSHKWKSTPRAWMHDYLLINLSAEYLFRIGESVKKLSPQGLLFINIARALIQFNEKSREVYKRRDEIEYEQLIRLNSLPEIDLTNLKHLCNQNLSKVNNEFAYLEKKIKSLQSKI